MSWLLLITVVRLTAKRIFAVLRQENGSQTSPEANLQILPNKERQDHHDSSTFSVHFTSLARVGLYQLKRM